MDGDIGSTICPLDGYGQYILEICNQLVRIEQAPIAGTKVIGSHMAVEPATENGEVGASTRSSGDGDPLGNICHATTLVRAITPTQASGEGKCLGHSRFDKNSEYRLRKCAA